jgi:poly(A) polymerase
MITKYKLFCENLKNDMWSIIPQSVKELHELFKSKGKKLYVVGGAVRDFLNSDKPKDFDLCTDALPDEVLEILGSKYRTNLQGKAFGVVVVFTEDEPAGMEIATFRSDVYDGKLGMTRNPNVKFTTIDQDVLRRDLRINGLFYDLDKKEIVDLVGGIDDIKNGVIGMIGDPDLRIKEDPLRILRAIRMACRL